MLQIPEPFQNDLNRAVKILKEAGCREIYIFGSVANGKAKADSDIDLAIRGCPPDVSFFGILGELLCALEHSVDLVDLDWGHGFDKLNPSDFAKYLEAEGELHRVA